MFFSAFIGNKDKLSEWEDKIKAYAGWLNHSYHIESRNLGNQKTISLVWLNPEISRKEINFLETSSYIVLSTDNSINYPENKYDDAWMHIDENITKNTVQIGISKISGEIKVFMPLSTPELVYYTGNLDRYIIGNDFRLLLRFSDFELDEHAIYGFLKYRSIPAPFSISKNIKRIPNAHSLTISSDLKTLITEPNNKLVSYIFEGPANYDERNLRDDFNKRLMNNLSNVPDSSAVFFSGGVDSSLLALKLAEIGRTDTRLINYISGPNDPAGKIAAEIADYIGLKYEPVMYEQSYISDLINGFFKYYSYPFSDPSTLPAYMMAMSTLKNADITDYILDGTGADSSFVAEIPVYSKYRKVYRIPESLRKISADIYKELNLWQNDSKVAKVLRIFRRSTLKPISELEFSNIFENIAFSIPDPMKQILISSYNDVLLDFSKKLSHENQNSLNYTYSSLINLIDCSNSSAAKTYDVLRMNGVKLSCPFLDPKILNLSFSIPWDRKENEEPKILLKRMLLSKIPSRLVNCPKGIFAPPYDILKDKNIREFLYDVVLTPENPISEFFDIDIAKKMLKQSDKDYIDPDLFVFLWQIMFISGWIYQMKSAFSNNMVFEGK